MSRSAYADMLHDTERVNIITFSDCTLVTDLLTVMNNDDCGDNYNGEKLKMSLYFISTLSF